MIKKFKQWQELRRLAKGMKIVDRAWYYLIYSEESDDADLEAARVLLKILMDNWLK